MLVPNKKSQPTRESRLADVASIAEQLPDGALATLHEFADFLQHRHPPAETASVEKVPIPRPEEEGVIPAIKRLSKTYPMLDKKILFEQTSAAMSAHVLRDVSAPDSIDRLEEVFQKEYESFLEQLNRN